MKYFKFRKDEVEETAEFVKSVETPKPAQNLDDEELLEDDEFDIPAFLRKK